MVTQFAKKIANLNVISVCSSKSSKEWRNELGADFVIDYKSENIEEKSKSMIYMNKSILFFVV